MSESDQRLEIEAPEETPADMPLPSDAKAFLLGGMFLIAMLATAYVAREIVLPLVFAVMLNLLMQPTLRALERLRVPKTAGGDVVDSSLVHDDRRTWHSGLRAGGSLDSQAA